MWSSRSAVRGYVATIATVAGEKIISFVFLEKVNMCVAFRRLLKDCFFSFTIFILLTLHTHIVPECWSSPTFCSIFSVWTADVATTLELSIQFFIWQHYCHTSSTLILFSYYYFPVRFFFVVCFKIISFSLEAENIPNSNCFTSAVLHTIYSDIFFWETELQTAGFVGAFFLHLCVYIQRTHCVQRQQQRRRQQFIHFETHVCNLKSTHF